LLVFMSEEKLCQANVLYVLKSVPGLKSWVTLLEVAQLLSAQANRRKNEIVHECVKALSIAFSRMGSSSA